MPQQVQVDGIGLVEFSDDFTPDEIASQVDNIFARQEMVKVQGEDKLAKWFSRRESIIPPPLIPEGEPGSIESVMGPSTAGRFVSGTARGMEGAVLGMGVPENIPLAPLALVPGVGTAMGIYFGGQALGSGAGTISAAQTPEEVGQGFGEMTIGAAMAGQPVAKATLPLLKPAFVRPRSAVDAGSFPEVPEIPAGVDAFVRPATGGLPGPKRQPIVVPETLADPMSNVTVLGEIRAKNARTVAEIQRLFPNAKLTREQAREFRNAAWGKLQEGGQGALPISEATEVYGNVPEQPRIRPGEVPPEEGAGGVPSGGVRPPGTAPGGGGKAPAAAEVPLTPLPESAGSLVQRLRAMSDRDLEAWSNAQPGKASTTMDRVGDTVATLDELNAIKKVWEETIAEGTEIAAKDNLTEVEWQHGNMVGHLEQLLSELYGKATGTGSAGQQAFQKIPGWAPKFPQGALTEKARGHAKAALEREAKAGIATPEGGPTAESIAQKVAKGDTKLTSAERIVMANMDEASATAYRKRLAELRAAPRPAPAAAPVEAKPLQIGDEQVIMQVPSVLADTQTIGGVKWDLFNGSKLKEKRSAVRTIDVDTGEVLQIKQFKDYDSAESYYKSETTKANKMERPAPVEAKAMPAPAPPEGGGGSVGPGMVGVGGAAYGERAAMPPKPGGPSVVQQERTSRRMEGKVKLSAQQNLEKLSQQFEVFDQEIGDALTSGGQFLPKELRPEVAKGKPAQKGTVTSKAVNQYFVDKLVTLHRELRRVRSEIAQQASIEQLEYYDLVLARAQHSFRQVQELRRASHESLAFWNQIKGEYKDLANSLRLFGELRGKKPILDQLWKDLRSKEWARAGKDAVEFARVNLFTLGSWTLDFATNLSVAATKLPAFAISDVVSLARGRPAYEMASAITAIRRNARNLVPGLRRFRLPEEIEVGLGTTAGSEFQGFGKEIMADFSEILKNDPELAAKLKKADVIVAAPVRMKRATDNFFGRLGAATELYHEAYLNAHRRGRKGEDFRTSVDNFAQAPPPEAIEAALKQGKEWKFNRDLSEWEERFGQSVITKVALEAFPRWTFQFVRWAGEMLGANPGLYRKIKAGTVNQREVVDGIVKAATGWGGLVAFNQLLYSNIDANSMEYVKEDGDRVRLSGRTPMPELFFITALLRGDWQKAKAALPQTSIPLAKFLGGEPGGIFSPIVDTMRESMRSHYTAQRTTAELMKLLNNLIPGKSVLGFMRSLYDPTVREGFGAPIPGVASLLPAKIDPTTGEPSKPMQKIPGTNFKFPTVGGTPFPGAVRSLNAIEAVLLNHGVSKARPRRTSLVELPAPDVPADLRREYERLAGSNVKRILGEGISQQEFWDQDFELRRKTLQAWMAMARSQARLELAQKYEKRVKVVPPEPMAVELLPDRYRPQK